MENKNEKTFLVEQKAVIWYRVEIEAESLDEALKIAREDASGELDWWPNLEGVQFVDSYAIAQYGTDNWQMFENE